MFVRATLPSNMNERFECALQVVVILGLVASTTCNQQSGLSPSAPASLSPFVTDNFTAPLTCFSIFMRSCRKRPHYTLHSSVSLSICPVQTVYSKTEHFFENGTPYVETFRRGYIPMWRVTGRVTFRLQGQRSTSLGRKGENYFGACLGEKFIDSRKTKTMMILIPCYMFVQYNKQLKCSCLR